MATKSEPTKSQFVVNAERSDDGGIVVIVSAVCPRDDEQVRLAAFRRKGHNTAIEEGGDSVMTGVCPKCGLDVVLDLAGQIAEKDRHAEAIGMIDALEKRFPDADVGAGQMRENLKDKHLNLQLDAVRAVIVSGKGDSKIDELKAKQDTLEKLLGIPESMRLPALKG